MLRGQQRSLRLPLEQTPEWSGGGELAQATIKPERQEQDHGGAAST